jgi:Raf kinase inhibitor-like YbhB/YbcL family protein
MATVPTRTTNDALAINLRETRTSQHLKVASGAFAEGDAIPAEYSDYDHGQSFPLAWSEGPIGTRTYAVLVEDPDVYPARVPFCHWLVWNIPARMTHLRAGLPPRGRLDDPAGAVQGASSSGAVGYFGPRPPTGAAAHHYHVQVFAIDRVLDLADGAEREELVSAIGGHVLASGELVGTFERI